MSAERVAVMPRERRFPLRYETFDLPPHRGGAVPYTIRIKEKTKAARLMGLFLNALKENKPVLLSEIKAIYNQNPQGRTRPSPYSLRKIRIQALGAKDNLEKTIEKQTENNWVIFSPDYKKERYVTENPSFSLMTKDQMALGRNQEALIMPKAAVVFPDGQQYSPTATGAEIYLRRIMQGNCTTQDLEDLSKDPEDPYKIINRAGVTIQNINKGLMPTGWEIYTVPKTIDGKITHSVHMRKIKKE